MAGAGPPTILHADLDAFYASVEQLLDPRLRGRPIAVGGGVVLAASYEARRFGVRGGMPGRLARALCPELQFVPGHFREYLRLSTAVMEVLESFTPAVEQVSIDEAFLDVAGSVHLFGSSAVIAGTLRRRVRAELGLPISVGVASTKHLAKVASQVAKPDGLVVVEAGHEAEFLAPLPVELLWGVGAVTRERLHSRGIRTIGQLAAADEGMLRGLLGQAAGHKLSSLSSNVDTRAVTTERRSRSVGAQAALGRQRASPELLRATFGYLADRVATRLRRHDRAGRTITVRVRFADLRSVTRSRTLPAPVDATFTITEVAVGLAGHAVADHPDEREVSLLGLGVSKLVHQPALQLELPLGIGTQLDGPGTPRGAARWSLDRAVDRVRDRFGRDALSVASVRFADRGTVPDDFRELAEHDL